MKSQVNVCVHLLHPPVKFHYIIRRLDPLVLLQFTILLLAVVPKRSKMWYSYVSHTPCFYQYGPF